MTWRRRFVAFFIACSLASGCSPDQVARAAFALRGATVQQQDDAVRVAACESGGGDPAAIQPQVVSRGNWGMFQINWTAQHNRVERLGYTREQLLDPLVNATVAADLWVDLGRRFGTSAGWSCARIVGVR